MSESRIDAAAEKLERLLLEGLNSGGETCIDRVFWREIKREAAKFFGYAAAEQGDTENDAR